MYVNIILATVRQSS